MINDDKIKQQTCFTGSRAWIWSTYPSTRTRSTNSGEEEEKRRRTKQKSTPKSERILQKKRSMKKPSQEIREEYARKCKWESGRKWRFFFLSLFSPGFNFPRKTASESERCDEDEATQKNEWDEKSEKEKSHITFFQGRTIFNSILNIPCGRKSFLLILNRWKIFSQELSDTHSQEREKK